MKSDFSFQTHLDFGFLSTEQTLKSLKTLLKYSYVLVLIYYFFEIFCIYTVNAQIGKYAFGEAKLRTI